MVVSAAVVASGGAVAAAAGARAVSAAQTDTPYATVGAAQTNGAQRSTTPAASVLPLLRTQNATTVDWSFGAAVALSGDTALIGAPLHDVGTNAGQGAVYVFIRRSGVWSQQAVLTVSNGAAADHLGWSVALDGDIAVVGAPGRDVDGNTDEGAAYVFTRTDSSWKRAATLTAQDGASSDGYGTSVCASGATAVVGSPGHDVDAAVDRGAAYVITRTFEGWLPEAELTAADGIAEDGFGHAVALDGDTALVGVAAPDDPSVRDPAKTGAAYVFVRSGTWQQQAKLQSSDGAVHDGFGAAVALDGDTAVVGALYHSGAAGDEAQGGAAYVFTRSGSTPTVVWTQQGDPLFRGSALDTAGAAVDVSGDTVAATTLGVGSGPAVRVGERSAGVWDEDSAALYQRTGGSDQLSVALEGDIAVVGDPNAYETSSGAYGGAGFLRHSTSGWVLVSMVTADAVAPTSTATLSPAANDAGWHRRRVKVTLRGSDARSGVARIEYRALGSSAWTKYSSPFRVSTNGTTKYEYRSRDRAGNLESPKQLVLRIDSRKPTVRMYAVAVKRGRKVRLRFKVSDPQPSSRRAVVTMQVFKGRVTLAMVKAGTRPCNTVQSRVWRCSLPRGVYKIVAFATDRAGNDQRRAGHALLIVR